jgi:hypothetical protein
MDAITKLIFAACALLLSGGLWAQTFKCVDALGKITYAGKKCSELGLKDAGEVKDRLNINPAYPSQPSTTREGRPRTPSAPAQAPAAQATEAQPAAEPATPERRCFTVKTAKGNVTRCNDTPD